MKKNNSRRFPALMVISMLVLSPVLLFKIHSVQAAGDVDPGLQESGSLPEEGGESGQQTKPTQEGERRPSETDGKPEGVERSEDAEKPDDSTQTEDAGQPDDGGHPEGSAASESASQPEEDTLPATPEQGNASSQESISSEGDGAEQTLTDFFSHTLFIGDSRTVGLMEYAGLETPDFYASSGMSLFKMWEKEMEVPGMGKLTLQELLEQKTYDRIFLMTGLNELGYAHSAILKKYAEAAETIQNLQPQAKLYLCANLHVTGSRSDRDDTYNNANIDWLNGEIAGIASSCGAGFLDVNPLFDDEAGALREDFSGDETHPYGKYYQEWGEWLFETCKNAEGQKPSPDESDTG